MKLKPNPTQQTAEVLKTFNVHIPTFYPQHKKMIFTGILFDRSTQSRS